MSASESNTTVLSDFLSVPKIIGIGPIMMAPPLLTFPFIALLLESKIIAAKMMTMPTRIRTIPDRCRISVSLNVRSSPICSFHGVE